MVSLRSSARKGSTEPTGLFTLNRIPDGPVSIKYVLSKERLQHTSDPNVLALASNGSELLSIAKDKSILTIFPIHTFPEDTDFLQPRYGAVHTISLEGFDIADPKSEDNVFEILDSLPAGFIKDPEYGLGLQKDFRFIIEAITKIEAIANLVISKLRASCIDGNSYVLSFDDFEVARKGINRIHRNALNEAVENKTVFAHNALLTSRLPSDYPETQKVYKPDTIFKAVTGSNASLPKLSANDRKAALKLVSANRTELSKSDPGELLELRRDIELVTLEQLIKKLEEMMTHTQKESHWQKLFLDNPFILSLAFGLPIIAMQGHVSIGGRKFDGTGDKIADFLHRNECTNNVALIEIKTHTSKLIAGEYRGGVYGPSNDLAGAITQVLDQRYQLQKNISGLKENSRRYDIESYAIKCVIVIGKTPEDDDQKKSFELFRSNLNDVLVITFDELLRKLKHLHTFLSPS